MGDHVVHDLVATIDRHQNLAGWVVFNWAVPLLGIGLVRLYFWIEDAGRGFVDIVKDGQLLFLCGAVVASSLFDLYRGPGAKPWWLLTLLLPLIANLALFGIAVSTSSAGGRTSQIKIAMVSVSMLIVTCLFVVVFRAYAGVDDAP